MGDGLTLSGGPFQSLPSHSAQQAAAISPTHEFGKRKWSGLVQCLWVLSWDLVVLVMWCPLSYCGGGRASCPACGSLSPSPQAPIGCCGATLPLSPACPHPRPSGFLLLFLLLKAAVSFSVALPPSASLSPEPDTHAFSSGSEPQTHLR